MAAKRTKNSTKVPSLTTAITPWTALIGFDASFADLAKLLQRDALPPVLLFAGREGIGKTSFSLGVAALSYCDTAEACGKCAACLAVLNRSHPEIFVADIAAAGLKIEDAARIQEHLMFLPDGRSWSDVWRQGVGQKLRPVRTIVITDIDRLNSQGANRLLKTLEEPGDNVRFVMTTSRPEALLPTVRSRSVLWHLQPPSLAASKAWLETQVGVKSPLPLEEALRLSALAPGRALELLRKADLGLLGLMARLKVILAPSSLNEAMAAAHELSRSEGVGANHIAEAAELVLNQHYYALLAGAGSGTSTISAARCAAWRGILTEVKSLTCRAKVPLAKQLLAEALALAGRES